MRKDIFDDFDTSYWHPKDKAWVAEREQQWREVEKLLFGLHKSKKAVGICKRYFFKGTLPDWKKLQDWESYERHLDLMLFLYLHPSRDEVVLRPLCEGYLRSRRVRKADILQGFYALRSVGESTSCQGGGVLCYPENVEKGIPHLVDELELLTLGEKPPYTIRRYLILHTQGSNEWLFRLMCPDPEKNRLFELAGQQSHMLYLQYRYQEIQTWGGWLRLPPPLSAGAADMLFQYDLPLETWYVQCTRNPDSYRRMVEAQEADNVLIGLYRIHHFDLAAEGDSPRSRFVQKFTAMLEQREFHPEFKALWEEVKRGEVEVENVWGPDCRVLVSKVLGIQRVRSSAAHPQRETSCEAGRGAAQIGSQSEASCDVPCGTSLLRIRPGRIMDVLAALDFEPDEDSSAEDNLSDCLSDLDWVCVGREDGVLAFRHENSDYHDQGMDWEVLIAMAPFLEEGSFYEEGAGDYVEDRDGNSCSGVLQARVEDGILRCHLYALVTDAEGRRSRQLIEEIDPQLI